MGCNRAFDRILPGQPSHRVRQVTQVFTFSYFFKPDLVPVLSRLAGPDRVLKPYCVGVNIKK